MAGLRLAGDWAGEANGAGAMDCAVLRDHCSARPAGTGGVAIDRVGGASRPRPHTPPYVLGCIRRFRLMFERVIFEDQRYKTFGCEPIGGHGLMNRSSQ